MVPYSNVHKLGQRVFATVASIALFFGFALTSAVAQSKPSVVILYDIGGKFDSSFNEAAYNGAKRWADETGLRYRDFEPTSETQFEQAVKRFARRKTDVIIAVGIAYAVAVDKVAREFPDVNFTVIDSIVDLPNVRSVTFREDEGSFIVGALAAMKSEAGQIGFMGGMDIPLIRRFSRGYREGASYINPDIKIIENYVGVTPAAWNDPIKASELARGQYGRGADIVFHAAGPSGLGVIQAAKDTGNLVIGVDSNQNGIAPGSVLTSMLKRVDVAVYTSIKETLDGSWTPGLQVLGISDGGVDYALDEHNADLISDDEKKRLDEIKQKIVSGEISLENDASGNSSYK